MMTIEFILYLSINDFHRHLHNIKKLLEYLSFNIHIITFKKSVITG